MKSGGYRTILFATLLFTAACLEPYNPPILTENPKLLVVDAFINLNDSSASVELSRSAILASGASPELETGANVGIEDDGLVKFHLPETDAGIYTAKTTILSADKKYRLTITTLDGREYESDYITLKKTPPIDDLTWRVTDNGVQIYADTHDPAGKSHYYKWTYYETWEYNAHHEARLKLTNGRFTPVAPEDLVYTCWRTIPGSKVLVATTDRLRDDIINDFKIQFILKGSIKISKKYSILVQQQTLSEDGYNYWLNIQKTTEDLGSLFDPLPSQVIGNIHCMSNPQEPVIGYFDGASVTTKRIFIDSQDLPGNFRLVPAENCPLDSVIFENHFFPTGNASYVVAVFSDPTNPRKNGYLVTPSNCYDCRSQGGLTTKPDFWE